MVFIRAIAPVRAELLTCHTLMHTCRINGVWLGNHPYGYTTFAYDLTPHLAKGGKNVIAVRVRNNGANSRWYSGR